MEKHYVLLTPGPLTTTASVKEVMLKDWCTWDDDYKQIVQSIRAKLLDVGRASSDNYTSVLMQGSGTFGVEACIGTAVPKDGKLLVIVNGAYGQRIQEIADVLGIANRALVCTADQQPDIDAVDAILVDDASITHVAFVHCETTTGILNPLESLVEVVKKHGKTVIVDAMSSFGGIPIDVEELGIDFLISSANKCIQGVPGFSFVICRTDALVNCKGNARSLSLDLYDQWKVMEAEPGKWRFTSPTHVVRAFYQALHELEAEGGVDVRFTRYYENQRTLVKGMEAAGLQAYLPPYLQSPIITTFLYPSFEGFSFESLYMFLKEHHFVIYPGKLSDAQVFRIGTIGDVQPEDIERLCDAVQQYVQKMK
ncbi:2-aminoethylphosphonate--pyruvate transaminase [Paenibacillus selenitireducens]|uniref:2-aminoethylphosphonate--pyruvate transaminase n=1 Tax=Paenibacillus selenitireducens TaxID=1324314 RepID=A0A1T2X2F1_9BACL|nr:2-aminoethylphosphonate--pyruvate transaminase [Paenibacillus selenitireducens]OPA74029.1 2-aminoethylphosphonate--pyruvate transaminase [Paenibacillus selenitireducens]